LLLRIEGETLQIEGELVSDAPEGMEAIYAEVRLPRYRRAFTLSRELDTEKINAAVKDGVLHLRMPKAEHAQARRIEVQATRGRAGRGRGYLVVHGGEDAERW